MADNWETTNGAGGAGNAWDGGEGSNNNNGDDRKSAPAADGADGPPAVDDVEAKQKREEFKKKARDVGWTNTTAFDYAEFQRTRGKHATRSTQGQPC